MKFAKVRVWSWHCFFSGEMSIHTAIDTTEDQVRQWIEKCTSRGGAGNYRTDSLTSQIKKVKAEKVRLTDVMK